MFDNNGKAIGKDNPLDINVNASAVIQPVDVQARYTQTIQTQNGQAVGASTFHDSSWIDCNGFDRIAITVLNSGATANHVHLHWSHDGSALHGMDSNMIPSTVDQYRAGETLVKARYVRVRLNNGHTAPVTMSAWAYLKA